MKVSRYVSIAAPERQRFASAPQILAFAWAMLAALATVFPAHSLQSRLESSTRIDAVSMTYLGAWLHAKPDDYGLRLILARHQMQQGDFKQGEGTLAPMLLAKHIDNSQRIDAEVLLLDIRERELWQMNENSPDYAQVRATYLAQLRLVADYPSQQSRLRQFADTAFSLGDNALGRELYVRLINENPGAGFGLINRLVQFDLADGDYRGAATLYFNALPYTRDVERRRLCFLAGLHILQSGNLLKDAVLASQTYVGPLANDSQTLTYMVNLALAEGRPDIAAKLAARLLKQHIDRGVSA